MADTSASGFLLPTAAAPYDDPLEDILQEAVAGITGLPGDLCRPRWQVNPPPMPAFDKTWVAFGITRSEVDTFAFDRHIDALTTAVERDEILYVLHSFYGPQAHGMSERLRDGFEVSQNRDTLRAAGIVLIEVQQAVQVPALLMERWQKRIDVLVVYKRRTSRAYTVRTIESAQVGLDNEFYVTPINPT